MKDAKGHGSDPRGSHMQGVMKATMPIKLTPQVIQKMQANLQKTGGFSFTPSGSAPSDGFMVSAPGRSRIVSESELSGEYGHRILQDYAQQHSDALREPGAHVGGWNDNGRVYLDVSHRVPNQSRAENLGRQRNQISIWDVKNKREIKTGGTGE